MPLGIASEWWTLLTISLGAIIGAAGSIIGGIIATRQQYDIERKNLRSALNVEIDGHDHWLSNLYANLHYLCCPDEELSSERFGVLPEIYESYPEAKLLHQLERMPPHYFQTMVFTENIDSIGYLDDGLVEDIIIYYKHMNHLKETFDRNYLKNLDERDMKEEIPLLYNQVGKLLWYRERCLTKIERQMKSSLDDDELKPGERFPDWFNYIRISEERNTSRND